MLIGEVFNEFVKVVNENKRFVIGLVDNKQSIIACSDDSYINKLVNVNSPDQMNVYFQINIDGYDLGYLWVNGQDENLQMISKLLYDSLEIRLKYEISQASLNYEATKDDIFIQKILENNNNDYSEIIKLADEMDMDLKIPRCAVLITRESGFQQSDVFTFKANPINCNSIISLINRKNLVIFKEVKDGINDNKLFQKEFREGIQYTLIENLESASFFIGSIQNNVTKYKSSYELCNWLKKSITYEAGQKLFLMDYMEQLLMSRLEDNNVIDIYDYYYKQAKAIDLDEMSNIVDVLSANDFNLTHAAEDLFLHKNTLIYKIKKYEEVFQIDIRSDFFGKLIIVILAKAYKNRSLIERVGD